MNESRVNEMSKSGHEDQRTFKRGEVYMADLPDVPRSTLTSVQMGFRPVIVLQNASGNQFSTTLIVAKITASPFKKDYPMHQSVALFKPSTILFEQIVTIDKSALKEKIKELTLEEMIIANQKLMLSLGVDFFDLRAAEVKKRILVTRRDGSKSAVFEIHLWSQYRSKVIEVPLEKLAPLKIHEGDDLSYIEQQLNSFRGIRILNKFTTDG